MGDDFIRRFRGVCLTQLQQELKYNSAAQLAQLRDEYLSAAPRAMSFARMEQANMAVSLQLLTQPIPSHISQYDYMRIVLEVMQAQQLIKQTLSALDPQA